MPSLRLSQETRMRRSAERQATVIDVERPERAMHGPATPDAPPDPTRRRAYLFVIRAPFVWRFLWPVASWLCWMTSRP